MPSDNKKPAQAGSAAVGAYLRFLRESEGLTVGEIASKVGIDPSQIWRIESGKTDTRGSFLFKFIAAVNGDPNDVALLIGNLDATKEDGETVARLRKKIVSQNISSLFTCAPLRGAFFCP